MKEGVLIEVKDVAKKYCKDLKKSLKYGLSDLSSQIFGKSRDHNLRDAEFWAVNDISFELKRGECLGLIGHNGAGKSTLLKLINGLVKPDKGQISLKGRISALIELGAGFNPILTGRENIYNNAAVLGITKKEVDNSLDEIIDFADLESFIDMPVQFYSSGMKVRLGFAVASQMKPDIFLIDEVLAVGDMGFALKCFQKIDVILPDTAIIFVSHNMPMVSRMCSKILLMEKGQVQYLGDDVSKGIDLYYEKFSNVNHAEIFNSHELELVRLDIENECIEWLGDLIVNIKFKNKSLESLPFVGLSINDKENRGIAELYHESDGTDIAPNQEFGIQLKCPKIELSKGFYTLSLMVLKSFNREPILRINNLDQFQVLHKYDVWPPFLLNTEVKIKA